MVFQGVSILITFVSAEFRSYLIKRGIAQSRSAVYHPAGNSQVERHNGAIWRAVRLALKTRNMPITQWERVLHDLLFFMMYRIRCDRFCVPALMLRRLNFFKILIENHQMVLRCLLG